MIYLLILAMLVCGCATGAIAPSAVSPKLPLGMTEQEVFEKFGQPYQKNSVKSENGRIYESFVYKNGSSFTYIYFVDGKVYHVGQNPAQKR